MKKLIATSILCFLAGTSVFAQHEVTHKCGTNTALEETFKMHPELEEPFYAHRLLMNSKIVSQGIGTEKNVTYSIPVVFHIIHEYGIENIDDSQVYDCMEVVNREFNAEDPDSVDVVAEFQNLIGDANIEFKLAAIDPFGNCTNGIEHIYSHETRVGDATSKLHQWNRARYLNVWVVKIVGVPGAAAYATYPAGTDGNGYWRDGALSGHTYVGSIGTGSVSSESVLTHEIAHWLGVAHTFGDSDLINDGPTICNDDGVADTPVTKGHLHCNFTYPTQWIDCDTTNGGVVEDLQNYMDYSYCDRHFTPGQVQVMHNTLNEIAGQRNILWTDSTLMLTGVDVLSLPQVPVNDLNPAILTVPLCDPVADFSSTTKYTCVGSPVTFTNFSWNAVYDQNSTVWTFEDGTITGGTQNNPVVTFSSPGFKTVTLEVANNKGTGIETRTDYMYISDWPDYNGPVSHNLEPGTNNWFIVNNPEDNYASFQLSNGTGYNGSRCFKLNNFKDVSNADLFNDDFFYNMRLGLSTDELITPSMDLRNTTNINVSFKFSYATNATQIDQMTETLRVYYSRDCGETWLPKNITVDGASAGNSINEDELVTGGYAGYIDYVPTSTNDWSTGSFNFTSTAADDATRFKFVFEASDFSSNLYIDDINIDGTLSLTSNEIALLDLNVFPNPTANGDAINVSYTAQDEVVTFTLRDAQGKVIATEVIEQTNTLVNHTLKGTQNLQSACYFLEVQTGDHTVTRKVIVL